MASFGHQDYDEQNPMTTMSMKRICILFICLLSLAFQAICQLPLIRKKEASEIKQLLTDLAKQHKPDAYIFRNATVITMKDSTVLLDHDILIQDGIIMKIGQNISVEPSVKEIEAGGKFLMPGLTDMHAHLFLQHPLTDTWRLHLLLSGVTTVRDMNGGATQAEALQLRDKVVRNEVFSPTIYQASQLIDSRKHKFFVQVTSPEQGRSMVIDRKKSGYDFIKIYDGLKPEVYHAIMQEASKQNILIVGHVPDAVKIEEALRAGQNSIEHLTGYFEWEGPVVKVTAPNDYANLTAQSQTWNCPTLYNHLMNGSREFTKQVLMDSVSALIPRSLHQFWTKRQAGNSEQVRQIVDIHGAANFETHKNIVLSLYQSNAKLIAGTDAGNLPFLIPGYALFRELKLMSAIGIGNYDVLKMATCDASLSMGKSSTFGTIQEGLRADLLLLNGNPILDLNYISSSNGIMVRGIWISASQKAAITAKMKSIFGN